MLLVVLIGISIGNAASQEVSVQIQSSKSHYLTGEHAPVHIRANADRMLQISWPEFTDTIAQGLKILRREPVDTVTDPDGIAHYQLTFIVSAYDTGRYVIHPITVRYKPFGTNEIREASTSYLTLCCSTISVEEGAGLRDIKGPMAIGWSVPEIVLLVLAVLFILLLIWFLIRRFRRKVREKTLQPDKTPVSAPLAPWEIALQALQVLRGSSLLPDGHAKQYWVELSGILREYIHRGLGINAPELTTRQTTKRLSSHAMVNPSLLANITTLLQLADMVKFAKALPSPEESLEMTNQAVAFIAGTAPAHVKPKEDMEEQQ